MALQGEATLREEAEARALLAEERAMSLQARLTAMETDLSAMRGDLLSAKMSQAQLEENIREQEQAVASVLDSSAAGGISKGVQSGEEALSAHMLLLRGVEEALHSAKAALR
jgi:hypothetical protein